MKTFQSYCILILLSKFSIYACHKSTLDCDIKKNPFLLKKILHLYKDFSSEFHFHEELSGILLEWSPPIWFDIAIFQFYYMSTFSHLLLQILSRSKEWKKMNLKNKWKWFSQAKFYLVFFGTNNFWNLFFTVQMLFLWWFFSLEVTLKSHK